MVSREGGVVDNETSAVGILGLDDIVSGSSGEDEDARLVTTGGDEGVTSRNEEMTGGIEGVMVVGKSDGDEDGEGGATDGEGGARSTIG